jgi:putative pyruvate formate lyase activating enzyme
VVPDLAQHLIPLLRELGADESLWKPESCATATPIVSMARTVTANLPLGDLKRAPTRDLWELHDTLCRSLRSSSVRFSPHLPDTTSLLDLKVELAERLLSNCGLCIRRCGVDRLQGETGYCRLGRTVQVGAYAMLYNEGSFVGSPTFSVFIRGCSLRCSYCYRPEDWDPDSHLEMDTQDLASLLDSAATSGARSWHFLGGNPDSSLPEILRALSHANHSLPVVWNSALVLSAEAMKILKEIVDVWVCDFKFGNDQCARLLAGCSDYIAVICRNLEVLRAHPWVVVRHTAVPGHEVCCTARVRDVLTHEFPQFSFVERPAHIFRRWQR